PAKPVEQELLRGGAIARRDRPAEVGKFALLQANQRERHAPRVEFRGIGRGGPGDVPVVKTERTLASVVAADEQQAGAVPVAEHVHQIWHGHARQIAPEDALPLSALPDELVDCREMEGLVVHRLLKRSASASYSPAAKPSRASFT